MLSSGTISVNFHPLPVFQLLLPSATLLLSTCFTFCTITLTYPIPVPGQLYDPAPAIPSFFKRLLNLVSFGWLCFNYYLYHGRCLTWVLASRSHLPFWPYHFKSVCTYISFFSWLFNLLYVTCVMVNTPVKKNKNKKTKKVQVTINA